MPKKLTTDEFVRRAKFIWESDWKEWRKNNNNEPPPISEYKKVKIE